MVYSLISSVLYFDVLNDADAMGMLIGIGVLVHVSVKTQNQRSSA